jgi:hypothetical protein
MVSEPLVLDFFDRKKANRNPSSTPKESPNQKKGKERDSPDQSLGLAGREHRHCGRAVPLYPVRIGMPRHWTKNMGNGGIAFTTAERKDSLRGQRACHPATVLLAVVPSITVVGGAPAAGAPAYPAAAAERTGKRQRGAPVRRFSSVRKRKR